MKREDLTEKLLDIKRERGWTWKYICEEIGGMSPILVTGAILGQHKLTKPQAEYINVPVEGPYKPAYYRY